MLPNCEHEDCGECLELAEACSGIRFNNMVMMAQIARRDPKLESRSWSGAESLSGSLSRIGSTSRSGNWYLLSWSWSWSGNWSLSNSKTLSILARIF